MITNYKEFKEFLNDIPQNKEKPTLLIHSCCGPCSSHVLALLNQYFQITKFYYNPNIYPEDEFQKRLKEQQRLIKEMKLDINIIEGIYEYDTYLYDQKNKEINAKTEVIQQEDKNLELKLQRLDNERTQITTEIEAVEKVINDNIEASYKTFSG